MRPLSPACGRLSSFLPVLALALSATSCRVIERLNGTDTIDLTRANLRRMTVSLRKEQQTICPREQVQMAVFITAVLDGAKDETTFETWAGRGDVNKNDKLDFTDFTFQSEQGKFDKDGWFAPLEALPTTAGKEFVVHATYNPSAAVFSYTYKWKPDYACITTAGGVGPAGAPGGTGRDGAPGKPGEAGGVMSIGGDGRDGASGGAGADGSPGTPGPKLRAVVTYVKTPFYDKLVGVRLTGAITDLLLLHPGRPFVVRSNGGPGGMGGGGGNGGPGGTGAAGNPGGHGGAGGGGGAGGRGGSGGAGGAVELVYDARFPDLASAVAIDVSGGPGGPGGGPGMPGPGGAGGAGMAPANAPVQAKDGVVGHEADPGAVGAVGRPGAIGTSQVHAGSIGDAFAGLADITVLTAPAAAPARGAR
jgi:hypothetical protein